MMICCVSTQLSDNAIFYVLCDFIKRFDVKYVHDWSVKRCALKISLIICINLMNNDAQLNK